MLIISIKYFSDHFDAKDKSVRVYLWIVVYLASIREIRHERMKHYSPINIFVVVLASVLQNLPSQKSYLPTQHIIAG